MDFPVVIGPYQPRMQYPYNIVKIRGVLENEKHS